MGKYPQRVCGVGYVSKLITYNSDCGILFWGTVVIAAFGLRVFFFTVVLPGSSRASTSFSFSFSLPGSGSVSGSFSSPVSFGFNAH